MNALFVIAAVLWALWALDLLKSLYRLTSPLHPRGTQPNKQGASHD